MKKKALLLRSSSVNQVKCVRKETQKLHQKHEKDKQTTQCDE